MIFSSGPKDRVFVYFADHGGVGLICFPNDDLYVDDLTKALKSMLNKKSFNEVNFYLFFKIYTGGSNILPQNTLKKTTIEILLK